MKTNLLRRKIQRKRRNQAEFYGGKPKKKELTYKCDNFRIVPLTYGMHASILSLFRALP